MHWREHGFKSFRNHNFMLCNYQSFLSEIATKTQPLFVPISYDLTKPLIATITIVTNFRFGHRMTIAISNPVVIYMT